MRRNIYFRVTSFLALWLLAAMWGAICLASPADDVEQLLRRADTLIWLGIGQKGAGDAFEIGLVRLNEAESALALADIPGDVRAGLDREIGALREQLEVLTELYQDRFYGAYPLARLLLPSLLAEEGFAVTEQLFHPPEIAAIESAAKSFSSNVDSIDVPYVISRSVPRNPLIENVAFSALARHGKTIPVNRYSLLRHPGAQRLARFDAGDIDSYMLADIMASLNAESLIVAAITPATGNGQDLVKFSMHGDVYQRGEVVQGSPVDATPALRVATISSFGTILDRRAQLWPIVLAELSLLVLAMLVALNMGWSSVSTLKPFSRAVIGAGLFFFGRIFTTACIVMFSRFAPDPTDLIAAAWWWPALLGLTTILGSGLLAWIFQARLSDVLPGARGARAVGTIFGLTALGGASYFIGPELMLNQAQGYLTIALYGLNAVALAVLFAFAVRTGPPVPTYFAVFPFFLAPILGAGLIADSRANLWGITAVTLLVYAIATARHRYAVARGIEEREPDQAAAAEADREKLTKLRAKLKK